MSVEVIEPGDKGKQGNATCPQCGEVVLIKHQCGDPPRCGECNVPYVPKQQIPKWH